jgi:large subunit ribosomal protein L31e
MTMAKQDKLEQQKEEVENEELVAELNEDEAAKPETKAEAPAEEETAEEEAPEEIAKPKKKKKDEEFVEEKIYTIPLQRALVRPPKKRTPRAMQLLKIFLIKHMKIPSRLPEEEEDEEVPQLIISKEVNEKLWSRGIEKPPRRIRVRAAKDKDGNVTVFLAETQ